MKRTGGITTTLVLSIALWSAAAIAMSQEEVIRHENVTVHVIITADGVEDLPTGSTMELKGDVATCNEVQRTQNIQSGEATFSDIPRCRISLRFFITGFDSQSLTVDFAHYKDPLRIRITHQGPHLVEHQP